jgi:DNA (cytosine-5)-methyltransferase 1
VALPTCNVLSLCAGYGGLDLGLRVALGNTRTVCWVEWDAYPAALLAARIQDQALDDAPLWSDARTFDGRPWRGVVDCVVGGYPCQPFSVAGKRRGADDPRHLWPHIARIVGEVRPRFCFFENVRNHINLGLEQVRADLRGMGYRVEAGIFSAAEVGASHRRERLFILAHTEGARLERRSVRGDANAHELAAWSGSPEVDLLAPGPDDLAWRSILDRHPGLAPATQSPLRGLADGAAPGVAGRAEQLRAGGNGVVPLQAAYAFSVLARRAGIFLE